MSWKDRWNFVAPAGVLHEVEPGKEMKFYPISISYIFQLKGIAAPLIRALFTLFQNEGNDVGTVDETVCNKENADNFTSRKMVDPVNIDLARFRLDTKQSAISEVVTVLFGDAYVLTIVRLIMNSLKDEFDRGAPEEKQMEIARELLSELDIEHFYSLLLGLYKGNKKVFTPLVNMVVHSRKVLEEKLHDLGVNKKLPVKKTTG